MQSNTVLPKSRTCTSRFRKTEATNGSSPCETMAWGLTLSTLKGSSSYSSACTDEKSSRVPESDWRFARRLWNGWAGEYGWSRNLKRVRPFSLPCQKETRNDEIDWPRRVRYRSFPG